MASHAFKALAHAAWQDAAAKSEREWKRLLPLRHPLGSIRVQSYKLEIDIVKAKVKFWTPMEDALLGTDSDKAVAARSLSDLGH
jgi:hypothetical protein